MALKPKKQKAAPATVALKVRMKKGQGSIVMFDPTAPEKPERVVMVLPGTMKKVKRLDSQSKQLGKRLEKAFQLAVKRAVAN